MRYIKLAVVILFIISISLCAYLILFQNSSDSYWGDKMSSEGLWLSLDNNHVVDLNYSEVLAGKVVRLEENNSNFKLFLLNSLTNKIVDIDVSDNNLQWNIFEGGFLKEAGTKLVDIKGVLASQPNISIEKLVGLKKIAGTNIGLNIFL